MERRKRRGKKNPWHIHLCKSFRVWKNLIQKQKPFESLPFPVPPCLAPPPLPSFTSPSSCWAVTVPTYQILLAASFPDTFLWMWPGSSSLQLLNCYVCHMLRRRRRRSWSIMTTGIRDSRQSQNAFSGEREAIYFNSWGNFAIRQVGGWGGEQDNRRVLSSPEGCESIASIHKLPLLRAPRCPWEAGVRRESRAKAWAWLAKEAPGDTIHFPWERGNWGKLTPAAATSLRRE